MKEEVLRVLKMVEEGKIDSEKASELIEALNKNEEKIMNVNTEKMLKVRVLSSERDTVNINLPIKFIKAVVKATGSIPIKMEGDIKSQIDTEALIEAIDSGFVGKFVDVKSANGDIVEVCIE